MTMISLLLLIAALSALAACGRVHSRSARVLALFFEREYSPALFLFFFSLAFQFLYWHFHRDLNYSALSVQGIPFSDARGWHDLASSLSEGRGFEGSFSGRRPLYPLLLACFYTWLGPSFNLAKALNILASALAVVLIYGTGKRIFKR